MTLNPFLAIIAAGVIWGTGGIFVKFIQLSPEIMSFFRGAVPCILVGLYLWWRKVPLFQGPVRLMMVASVLNAIRMWLWFVGFTYASIGNAVITLYTWPVFAALMGIFILHEKISMQKAGLLGLAFLGTILVFADKPLSFENNDIFGMSMLLLHGVLYALTIIIFKKESQRYSPAQTIFYQNIAAAFLFAPFLFIVDPFPELWKVAATTGNAILIGIVAFGLFFYGLKRMDSFRASALCYVEIVSAIVLAALFMNETLTWNVAAGGVLIVIAAILLTRIRAKPAS